MGSQSPVVLFVLAEAGTKSGKLCRGLSTQRAVGFDRVVDLAAPFDTLSGIIDAGEPVLVQALVPKRAVKS